MPTHTYKNTIIQCLPEFDLMLKSICETNEHRVDLDSRTFERRNAMFKFYLIRCASTAGDLQPK